MQIPTLQPLPPRISKSRCVEPEREVLEIYEIRDYGNVNRRDESVMYDFGELGSDMVDGVREGDDGKVESGEVVVETAIILDVG